MTRMSATQAMAVARLIEPERRDWDVPGIKAAVMKLDLSWELAAWVAIQCAADPTARTPGAMSNPIYRTGQRDQPVNAAPSAGRDNVRRLREEQAALAEVAARPESIARIRAQSAWKRSEA